MTQPLSFQSVILKLQEFWAERGCLIWQPYYTQVGAGTMNPATFLRVLGPEPWNVAYVEPSVRPDDGRYGENPNRFQLHYQFQVILKPDTGDPQELYLDSLKAIGVDPRQHDIRFVEDNWAQPAISAWGLGWEVWLDGQEITQFTYFQQVGGLHLDPVAVEITYGLERILIALHNAKAIWDVPWNEHIKYGEVRKREEFEHSKHYFEVADVERVRQMYELFEAEAKACLENGLVLPAHDYVLKCSHTFNILDTRGAVGVTERQAYFRRMRGLARRVAEAYVEQRKAAEFPLLEEQRISESANQRVSMRIVDSPEALILEIGVEELPSGDLIAALTQLREMVPSMLADLRLEHGSVRVAGTPRRLTVSVTDLAPRQSDLEQVAKGPPASRAFDADGSPTKAAQGFARGKGVDVSALETRAMDGGEYVVAIVKEAGRPAPEVLMEALPELVAGLKFKKSMRWLPGDNAAFSRPIRWLVALLGEAVIPFRYAGLTAGRITRGLRPHGSPEIEIKSADAYEAAMQEAGITLDPSERQEMIAEAVKKLAASIGGEALIEPDLLAEVANLVEKPTALLGSFDKEFLELPRAVLIGVMKKHQRYFPVEKNGRLLPHFVAIRNGDDQHLDIVRQGNEHVIRARFADADFFVREDVKQPLAAYRPKLGTLTFQTELGSMFDKSERMLKLSSELGAMLALDDAQLADLQRATFLAKADLVTRMVVEMTSLQGIMGHEYALRSGESQAVAEAIGEQYQTVPQSAVGVALALTDRLDSLVGLFAAGLAPTGTKDPFGLRRAAIGVVQPLIEHDIDFDLRAALKKAAALQPVEVSDEVLDKVLDFIVGRLRVLLQERGCRYDVVEAVLAAQGRNPAAAARAVGQLQSWVERDDWDEIFPAYSRCVRIERSAQAEADRPLTVDQKYLLEDAEKRLYKALQKTVHHPPSSVDEALNAVAALVPAINKFFDDVLVMAEDETVRANRLSLVGRIASLADGIADLSKLEGF
ncbi:MAG: glycine--tRNA ligase subunit beta [Chloroflexi bacterium]|nr:glycine--tRNA ligase subunit beta [Chloroflexota bacterium]